MKTDVRTYRKSHFAIVALAFISLAVFIVGMIIHVLSMMLAGSLGVIIFLTWSVVLKNEFKRHVVLMKEQEMKGPKELVDWLVKTSSNDRGAFLDFLEQDSLKKVMTALESYMTVHDDKQDLWNIHRQVKSLM